jgi:DNA-binding transcriptional ArsR family regulator
MLNESRIDAMFDALGDPTRRAIVGLLGSGSRPAGALAGPLAISLPGVVQQLRVLEQSGLIRTEKVGRARICHLEPDAFRTLEQWMASRRQQWERHFDRLGEVLKEQKEQGR